MKIRFQSGACLGINFLKKNISSPLIIRQNKKILMIASFIIGFAAACYLIHRYYYFKAEPLKHAQKIGKKIEQQEASPLPILISGKGLKGSSKGEPPNFEGINNIHDLVIDSEKLWTGAVACCFHTTQSHQEIYGTLRGIRIKMDPRSWLPDYKPGAYIESFSRLYNNLAHLHTALPGESKAKEVKIYWSESVEKELIPFLFMNENIDIDRLSFAIISGEKVNSPFRGIMDFGNQLQFIGIDNEKDELIEKSMKECENLSQEILGKNIFAADYEEFHNWAKLISEEIKNPLICRAFTLTLYLNMRFNLLSLQERQIKINIDEMPADERTHFFKKLTSNPRPTG